MKQPSLKKQIIIFLLQNLLVVLLIGGFIIYPAAKNIFELKKNIEQTHDELEQEYTKTKHLKKSLQELDSVKEVTAQFTSSTIPVGSELPMITLFEQLAQRYDIDQNLSLGTQDTVRYAMAKSNISDKYYVFSFLNHGTYKHHLQFLRELESMPFYVIIDKLQWSTHGSGPTNDVTLRFDALVYAHATQ
ncbi:MAG: hypothetical protein COV59_04455 [Candidatus Magasanikbacteria bacterium CG11_big_fil_rev_8_21_14_0_20_39_34]|uniref:Uncharacterized protein n=1 Tax=Candidatus Magasanikbacteria bacterium CG11_big_fil_rev_8_21_14_0_20_39_34 TaxID=1974653 RepID=A0A2H0N477_9BACT|nr:MAG: hypothetical protein COV59_04455 [Candidatus Magasanikbacteria bacterium CG11_big_fil_rev_8_21_14_0_20_39_34]